MERKSSLFTTGAVLVTLVLWASAFVAIRHVGHQVSAGALSLGRLVVGSAVLGVLVAARRGSGGVGPAPGSGGIGAAPGSGGAAWPRRGLWPRLVVVGVLWFGVYNVALNEGERHVDAGTAAMLVNVGPLLMAVLAGFLLKEGFPRPLVLGGLVSFGGVVLIGVSTSSGAGADTWGTVLCLTAAVAYAISVVVQKPLLAEASALHVTWLSCTIGALVCLPYAPSLLHTLTTASAATIAWIAYLGVMPTALAFTTWAYALARIPAGRLGASTYLVPPLAILLGWALLGETPGGWALVGGLICLVGVHVSRRQPRASAPVVEGEKAEVGV